MLTQSKNIKINIQFLKKKKNTRRNFNFQRLWNTDFEFKN